GPARRRAAEQQDVAAPERVREIGAARARGEENEPRTGAGAPSLERLPVDVTDDLDLIEVIHAGAAERTVAGRKARGLDDVRLEAEAGGETKNRARVLGNVGARTAQCAWAKLSGVQRTAIAAKTQDEQTICATFDRCDIDPHLPTCARLARVPIERRWIKLLGPLLAGGERPVRPPPPGGVSVS